MINSLFFGLVALISFAANEFMFQRFEDEAIRSSLNRQSLYTTTLVSSLERLAHLPNTISIHPDVVDVLNDRRDAGEFSHYLAKVNDFSNGAALYIMDTKGLTIASSNYETPESFVGKNYGFRPYFTKALDGEEGRVFAIGATTGRPGYFVSQAIFDGSKVSGVAVIKTEFEELLGEWRQAEETVLITDKDGIVILTSKPNYTYRAIVDLSDNTIDELKENKKFGTTLPTKLDFTSPNNRFEGRIEIHDLNYRVTNSDVPGTDWKIHYLTPLAPIGTASAVISGLVFLLCSLAGLLFVYFRGRIKRRSLEAEAAEAVHVREINTKLTNEIEVRKDAEKKLVEAQTELIQSSRLAALGTMSAAIVHEVNQPVSAIRTFSSSGILLSKSNRSEEAIGVFEQIKTMTERLGSITSDLLIFSRKPVSKPEKIDLSEVVTAITEQYSALLTSKNIALDLNLEPKAFVKGSRVRFEQLVSNLQRNAMQACPEKSGKIGIEVKSTASSINLSVTDNGTGIPKAIEEHIYDPFFTTKDIGEGVGLGLALCYAIADEANGKINAQNMKNGGAKFIVELPKYTSSREQAIG